MNYTTFAIIQICAVLIVVLQPILGWHAIPAFFNYSTASAIILGLRDGAILFTPPLIWTLTR